MSAATAAEDRRRISIGLPPHFGRARRDTGRQGERQQGERLGRARPKAALFDGVQPDEAVPSGFTCSAGAGSKRNEQCCPSPRVTGQGYSARAALVDALITDGCSEVAFEVARCASFLVMGKREVTLHEGDAGRRHLGGLNHCGRVVCPICGPFLMAQRLEALQPVVAAASKNEGLRFFYVVLSLRHRKGARFRELVRVLRLCQRALVQNRSNWRKVIGGWIRVLETTNTRGNGHHPHENLILAADASIEAEAFFQWLKAQFEKTARKHKRTAAWPEIGKDGKPHPWWSEIPREELARVVNYMGSDEKMGRPPAALREALGAATKHQPVWCMDPRAFAEVWLESKGLRWFGVGGIFKTEETDKSDEDLNEEREEVAPIIGYIPDEVFRSWGRGERRDRQAVLVDRSLTRFQALECLVAWGGIAGPPPEVDWGDSGKPPEVTDP